MHAVTAQVAIKSIKFLNSPGVTWGVKTTLLGAGREITATIKIPVDNTKLEGDVSYVYKNQETLKEDLRLVKLDNLNKSDSIKALYSDVESLRTLIGNFNAQIALSNMALAGIKQDTMYFKGFTGTGKIDDPIKLK